MKEITKKEFMSLLNKYLRGEATPEEGELIMAYYHLFDIRPDILNTLTGGELQQLELHIKDGVDQQIAKLPTSKKTGPVRRLIVGGVAAAAVTVAVVMLTVKWIDTRVDARTFTDKKNIIIPERTNIIELPDGSIVTLEPGSHLSYSPSFLDTSRDVYLEGQAYFDVKQLPQKPFVVHVGKLKTTVLGTAFNIKALSRDSNIVVTVTKGKVKLSNNLKTLAVLTPDEQVVYRKGSDIASKEKVSAAKATAWIQGDLILDNITVQNAAIIIGERFDVTIEVVDEQLKGLRFTTSLNMDDSLETIIKSIAQFNNASYQINKDKKHISIHMGNR